MSKCKECGRTLGHNGDTCSRFPGCRIEPLDTSTLGPIRADYSADAERARLVREALGLLATETLNGPLQDALMHLRVYAPDETLARLGRLLK